VDLSALGACAAALGVAAAAAAPLFPRRTLPRIEHPERHALHEVGSSLSTLRWEGLRAILVVVAALAVLAADAPPPLLVLAAAAPSLWLRVKLSQARERARRGMTRVIRAAHAALRSGAMLPDALERAVAAEEDEVGARPVVAALRDFAAGRSLEEALLASAAVVDPRTRSALETMALAIGERLPVERVAALVGCVADRLTFEERLDDEVRARASGARLQTWLLALIVPALSLYLAATVPSVAQELRSPLGLGVLLPAAAALEVGGIALSRRIVASALR
jgi:Flp pilus assembly protein TadB